MGAVVEVSYGHEAAAVEEDEEMEREDVRGARGMARGADLNDRQ
jgi:hypothetical protein